MNNKNISKFIIATLSVLCIISWGALIYWNSILQSANKELDKMAASVKSVCEMEKSKHEKYIEFEEYIRPKFDSVTYNLYRKNLVEEYHNKAISTAQITALVAKERREKMQNVILGEVKRMAYFVNDHPTLKPEIIDTLMAYHRRMTGHYQRILDEYEKREQ